LRAGSKINKIRTSVVPLEPGRSSLRLCSRDPETRWVPDRLPRLDVAHALATVELPLHLNWSAPGRVFDLRSRADRARVYEIVLQEGRPADILTYIDGALLVDLWDDLVLPRAVLSAWAPVVSPSNKAAA
jgi:hypothetical protein